MAKIYGGYLGEVVIRNMSGPGSCSTIRMAPREWFSFCEGLRMFPSDKVYNRLTEDPFSNVSGHCRALRATITLHRQ